MVRLNGTGVAISGHDEDLLKTQLESYYPQDNSMTAHALLELAAAKTITLSNGIGKPRVEGTALFLFWREQKKTGVHQYDVKELGESALFEIKNLLNKARFDTVSAPTILDFGLIKAKIEAESTVTIVKILKELQAGGLKYTPSAWGKRQIEKLGGRTGAAAEEHVANTPHASDQSNQFRLLSKYLYAYDRMPGSMRTLPALKMYLGRLVDIRAPNGNTYSSTYNNKKMNAAFSTTFPGYAVSNSQIFVWLIYAIQNIENTQRWSVNWKHGKTTANYRNYADALISVNLTPSILPNTRRVGQITEILMEAIQEGN
jgi:hypothetical protein